MTSRGLLARRISVVHAPARAWRRGVKLSSTTSAHSELRHATSRPAGLAQRRRRRPSLSALKSPKKWELLRPGLPSLNGGVRRSTSGRLRRVELDHRGAVVGQVAARSSGPRPTHDMSKTLRPSKGVGGAAPVGAAGRRRRRRRRRLELGQHLGRVLADRRAPGGCDERGAGQARPRAGVDHRARRPARRGRSTPGPRAARRPRRSATVVTGASSRWCRGRPGTARPWCGGRRTREGGRDAVDGASPAGRRLGLGGHLGEVEGAQSSSRSQSGRSPSPSTQSNRGTMMPGADRARPPGAVT